MLVGAESRTQHPLYVDRKCDIMSGRKRPEPATPDGQGEVSPPGAAPGGCPVSTAGVGPTQRSSTSRRPATNSRAPACRRWRLAAGKHDVDGAVVDRDDLAARARRRSAHRNPPASIVTVWRTMPGGSRRARRSRGPSRRTSAPRRLLAPRPRDVRRHRRRILIASATSSPPRTWLLQRRVAASAVGRVALGGDGGGEVGEVGVHRRRVALADGGVQRVRRRLAVEVPAPRARARRRRRTRRRRARRRPSRRSGTCPSPSTRTPSIAAMPARRRSAASSVRRVSST